jgi:DNA-binding transcriptional regulator YhcF (GntR family)
MNKITAGFLFVIVFAFSSFGQISTVTVKGQGISRNDALNDARRNAIATGIGTRVQSETQMQDMVAVRDAVLTQTQGIVTNERIVSEGQKEGVYEIELEATVNKDTYEANVRTLSQMVGGIRFLTIVNPELASNGELPDLYRFAVDRVNEYLLQKKYRVLESKRYFQILKATKSILDKDESDLSYEQKMGMLADAQMLFEIDKINVDFRPGAGAIPGQTKVFFDVKVFDNCTGELLGTTPLESGFVMLPNNDAAQREAVKSAVEKGMPRVLYLFNESMGSWINEGAPYRVRIYNAASPALTSRDMRPFKNKLTSNSDFGGTFEPNLNNGYFLYNISYKKRSDQMADLLMDFADETEALKPLKMDVSFQFGRFICFTPSAQKEAVKPLQVIDKVQDEIQKQEANPGMKIDVQGVIDKLQKEKVEVAPAQKSPQMLGAAPKPVKKAPAKKVKPAKK